MTGSTIELLLIGIMGFILIIAIVSTSDDTRKIKKLLIEINEKLDNKNNNTTPIPPVNTINSYAQPTKTGSSSGGAWNCQCGARVYNSDVCRNCGARRDQQ